MMLLDTLQMRRRMREAGFPEEQADAVTEDIANIVAGELATKEDLRELRSEMLDKFAEVKGEIAEVKNTVADLKVSVADSRTSTIKWIVGLVVAMLLGVAGMTIAVVVTLVRLFG